MSPDSISAIAAMLGAVAWPFVFLVFFLVFHRPIRKMLTAISELQIKRFKVGSLEAEVQTGLALGRAAGQKQLPAPSPEVIEGLEVALVETKKKGKSLAETLAGSVILWVDDTPKSNLYEKSALESLGARFVVVEDTATAVGVIDTTHFDLIISDMARPGDTQAGYTLLEAIRARGCKSPYIIYAGEKKPEQVQEAQRRGARTTNDPTELTAMVVSEITSKDDN